MAAPFGPNTKEFGYVISWTLSWKPPRVASRACDTSASSVSFTPPVEHGIDHCQNLVQEFPRCSLNEPYTA